MSEVQGVAVDTSPLNLCPGARERCNDSYKMKKYLPKVSGTYGIWMAGAELSRRVKDSHDANFWEVCQGSRC